MDAAVLLLSLFSAVTVAVAGFAVKRRGDVLVARMVLSVSMALCVLPAAFFVPLPEGREWAMLLGAKLVHLVYQFTMIRAMHRGDLSLVFPVMRGLSPLLTGILAALLLGEMLGGWQVAGLLLASLALLVFALPGNVRLGAGLADPAFAWSAAAALGIALYSVTDAHLVRQFAQPLTFAVWLFLFDWIGVTGAALYLRRGAVWAAVKPQLASGMLGGVAGSASYVAALLAFDLSSSVALVTALRETSVLWAALLGWLLLREGLGPRRVAAAAVLAGGLLMMQIG